MSTNNTEQHSPDAVSLVWPHPHFRALLWLGRRINTNQDPFYIKTKNQTQAFSYYFPFYPSSFVSVLMVMRVITFNHEILTDCLASPVSHLTPLCPRHHLQSPECFLSESKNAAMGDKEDETRVQEKRVIVRSKNTSEI